MNTAPIDVYDCPARVNGDLPLPYMIAVMQAADDGKPIQRYSHNGMDPAWHMWIDCAKPRWTWNGTNDMEDYRVARPASPFKVGDWVISKHPLGMWPMEPKQLKVVRGPVILDFSDFCCDQSTLRHATPEEIKAHLLVEAASRGFVVGNEIAPGSNHVVLNAWFPIVSVYICLKGETPVIRVAWETDFTAGGEKFCRDQEIHPGMITRPPQPKIAAGHNPAKLTEDQVGIKEGWRLLERDEIKERVMDLGKGKLQVWIRGNQAWREGWYQGSDESCIYRTKLSRADLAAFDTPSTPTGNTKFPSMKKVPLEPKDFGPITWIRASEDDEYPAMVTMIGPSIFSFVGSYGICLSRSYSFLMNKGWEYSPDLVNWYPCYKEIPA